MANLTKEQLLEKDYAELQALAEQMNILNYMDKSQDDLIYSILDAQADNSASSETPATPRKRTRIIKKNDADHIFSTDLSHQKIESPVVSEPAPAEPATVEAELPASEVAEPATAENANDAVAEDAADTLQTEVVEAPKRKARTSVESRQSLRAKLPSFFRKEMETEFNGKPQRFKKY